MYLAGQGSSRSVEERGYAMAALLTMIAVMAILLSAALPVWRHQMQREREAELVFRGEQYVRAIELFQRRHGPGSLPPSVDILVQQKFLRKKYKDPITGDDFALVRAGMLQQQGRPGQPGQPAQPGQPGQPGQPAGGGQVGSTLGTPNLGGPGPGGGIVGVVSKSEEDSIRIYRGRTKYHQWQFVYAGAAPQPGGPGQLRPGQQPGQPGRPGPGIVNPGRRPAQGPGGPRPLDRRPPG